MVGGKKDVYFRSKPVLGTMGDHIYMGPHGMGLAAKLINNLKTMTELIVIIEALSLGIKGGLKPLDLFKVITLSSGNSFCFQYRVPRMLKGDFKPGATVDIGYKDLSLAVKWAEELGVPLALPVLAREFYRTGQLKGLNTKDTAALSKLWEDLLGISFRVDDLQSVEEIENDESRWKLL